jgi:RNA polymerase sigma factor (sigma-70 family)
MGRGLTKQRHDRDTLHLDTPDEVREPSHTVKTGRRRVALTAEQQGLAGRYVPMAKSLAKPLKTAWPLEGEEFESAALMALVEAAQSFDPSRNVKFATFARYRIWGALRDVQRSLITAGWRGDVEHAPTICSLTYDAEEHGSVLNSEPDPPIGQELEAIEFVEHWLGKLPAKHADACRQIYIHGKTQSEAAETMSCSKSRLSYLHKEALDLINDAWAYRARLDAKAEAKEKDRARRWR